MQYVDVDILLLMYAKYQIYPEVFRSMLQMCSPIFNFWRWTGHFTFFVTTQDNAVHLYLPCCKQIGVKIIIRVFPAYKC